MLLLFSVLMGLFGLMLPVDSLFFEGAAARLFPGYMPTLVSFCGMLVAGLLYSERKKRRKPKKQRRPAVFAAAFFLGGMI